MYICEAENSVGSASASAQLIVLTPPTWNASHVSGSSTGSGANTIFFPKEIRGLVDGNVLLDCPVHGSPRPLVFWHREGRHPPQLITADRYVRFRLLKISILNATGRVRPNLILPPVEETEMK